MRYFLLLVCLTVSMVAHAYNEAITSIAYNPSRMGAYDYLKTNFLSLKAGLWSFGNTTEINLYGSVSITDDRSEDHQFNAGNPDPSANLHEISRIIPLSNYSLSPEHYTYCTTGQDWSYSQNACYGDTNVSPILLMGLGSPSLADTWPTSAPDSALVPNIYMYGGSITISSSSSTKFSWIKHIKRMYVTGSGPSAALRVQNGLPNMLTFETQNLAPVSPSTSVRVGSTITLSGMTMVTTAFNNCTASGRKNKYAWIERVTDDHKKIKILACK